MVVPFQYLSNGSIVAIDCTFFEHSYVNLYFWYVCIGSTNVHDN